MVYHSILGCAGLACLIWHSVSHAAKLKVWYFMEDFIKKTPTYRFTPDLLPYSFTFLSCKSSPVCANEVYLLMLAVLCSLTAPHGCALCALVTRWGYCWLGTPVLDRKMLSPIRSGLYISLASRLGLTRSNPGLHSIFDMPCREPFLLVGGVAWRGHGRNCNSLGLLPSSATNPFSLSARHFS